MPGLVGSWRCPELDLRKLAQTLVHTPTQRVSFYEERGAFVVAQVGSAAIEAPAREPGDAPVVLVCGEILELERERPASNRSADAFRAHYLRDPSCAFLARSSGVFSGIVFDPQRRRIVLFTDPLGVGQLYFAAAAGALLFASEQKCFARAPGQTRDVSSEAVAQFLREGQLCGETTWFAGVELIAPGHSVSFDTETGQITRRRYYEVARPSGGRYGSYQEAQQTISEAYVQAFERASGDVATVALPLAGDSCSRMLLASSEAAGLNVHAYTAVEGSTLDLLYAQRACAVRATIHHVVRPSASAWLLSRARLSWLADGADVSGFSLAALTDLRSRAEPRASTQLAGERVLNAALGELLLGPGALRGLDDRRGPTLLWSSARKLGAVAHALGNFAQYRFPFADPELWSCALRAEVPYLQHGRLKSEIALGLFPDYFSAIPVADLGFTTAPQLISEGGSAPSMPAPQAALDPYAFVRADAATERFIWQVLSSTGAVYPGYTEAKPAHAAFWAFFHAASAAAFAPLMRYVSLELWLQRLLRDQHLEPDPPDPPDPSAKARELVPDVTVIVPAYNVEAYVGQCLNSLRNQHLSSIEIIAVDDGSTDRTPAIIARFAAEDDRIRVIRSPNAGVYHARNLGLAAARGRYVSFVDADDYADPDMLQALLAAAEEHRAQVTFCDVYQFDAGGETRVRSNTLGFRPNTPLSLVTTPEMISDGFSTLWNRIYDRAFLARHGFKFDESYRISADMLFLQELIAKADTIVRVPRPLYYYRFATPNSLTSYEVRNAQHLVHLQITVELIDFWVRHKLFDRYAPFVLLKAVRNFLWNTHIDEARLREIFRELHLYLKTLSVSPVSVARIPAFERRVFQLIRTGEFVRFMRHVRRYRAKMVQAKGGELSVVEQLKYELDRVRSKLSRSVSLKLHNQPSKGQYRMLWPAARVGVTMAFGDRYQAVPGEPYASEEPEAAQLPPVVSAWRAARDRLLIGAELDRVLKHKKLQAGRTILHFSNAFSVPSETFTYDVISGLDELDGLDNYVMCFNRQLERERPYPKTIELHGASRDELEVLDPRAMSKIALVFARLKPALVHSHFGWVGVPLALWLARTRQAIPHVITMHGTDVNMWPARHAWYADALKRMSEMPSVSFTTHTETYAEKLVQLGLPRSQITVIPNSFDPTFAQAAQRHTFEPGQHLRVISVARMDIWKGHEHLIRGFERFVRERYSNASLSLVGYGPEEPSLRALVEQLGLSEKVRFYGRAAHHEVPVLLRNHDVYVQPSIKHPETLQEEGQPIAVLEAIATGMPVIVTDTGAMRETVCVGDYAGSAWVIAHGDAAAIAQTLAQIVETATDERVRRVYVEAIIGKHARANQLRRTLETYERAWAGTR